MVEHEMAMLSAHGVDLASFAATVASDTAHLTNLSVSPTNLVVRDGDYLDITHEGDSISPPSPNYFEDMEEVDLADPTPKSIDYQNSKRQKVRPPPTTDWSPVTDLSPILDVSPSVEKAEQEAMIAQQKRQMAAAEGLSDGSGIEQVPGNVDNNNLTIQGEPKIQMGLKRYHAFEDITKIGNGDLKRAAEIADAMAKGHSVTHLIESPPPPPPPLQAASMEPAKNKSHIGQQQLLSLQQVQQEGEQQLKQLQQAKYNNSERTGTAAADRAFVPGTVDSNVEDIIQFIDEIPRDVVAVGDQIAVTGFKENQDSASYPGSTLLNSSAGAGTGTTTVPCSQEPSITSVSSSQQHRVASPHYKPPPPGGGGTAEEPSSRFDQDISRQQSPSSSSSSVSAGVHRSLSDDTASSRARGLSGSEDIREGLGPRSYSDDQAKVKDIAKVKPHPLRIPAIDGEDDVSWSPHSKVLKSPISPRYKAKEECGEDVEISPSVVQEDTTAYLYPSPVTPPDTSPPQPRSPSVPKTDCETPEFVLGSPHRVAHAHTNAHDDSTTSVCSPSESALQGTSTPLSLVKVRLSMCTRWSVTL